MKILGREPTRKDIMDAILVGAIPITNISSLEIEERLALETIVLSPIIDRFVTEFDRESFIAKLDVLPLESSESTVQRAFDAYITEMKTQTSALLISQARGEFSDERRAYWTRLFGEYFEKTTTILDPIESAYEKLGYEAIKAIKRNSTGTLSLTEWGEHLHGARKVITKIASLRKADSDRTIRPLRQAGQLTDHITRRGQGFHIDLSALVPSDSRTGRGCPMNAVDPEGAPDIKTTLLLSIHDVFTDTIKRLANPVTPQLMIAN